MMKRALWLMLLALAGLAMAGVASAQEVKPTPGPRKLPPFEAMFLKRLATQQQFALKLAGAADAKTTSTELKAFLAAFIARKSEEQTQLKDFLAAWYPAPATPRAQAHPEGDEQLKRELAPAPQARFALMMVAMLQREIAELRMAQGRVTHEELKALLAQMLAADQADLEALKKMLSPPPQVTPRPTPKVTPKPTPRPTPKPTPRFTPKPTPTPATSPLARR